MSDISAIRAEQGFTPSETAFFTEAKGLIIDIMSMDVVDSFMVRVINDTAIQAGMLGMQVILCGMQPDVALTLIEMGRELIGVETALNLDQAFNRLETLIEEREA